MAPSSGDRLAGGDTSAGGIGPGSGQRAARPLEAANVGGSDVGHRADSSLERFGPAEDSRHRLGRPRSPRPDRAVYRRIAALPRREATGHGFEALPGALIRIGNDQRLRGGDREPLVKPGGVGQTRDRVTDDCRPQFGVALRRQPGGRAFPVRQPVDVRLDTLQLVDVMQQRCRFDQAAIELAPSRFRPQRQPAGSLGDRPRVAEVPGRGFQR